MVITFEKIRELQRGERDTPKPQRLPKDIMKEIREYLELKESITDKSSTDLIELQNVKNIIKDWLDMREHKVLSMALSSIRSGMPPENLTESEELLFFSVINSLKGFKVRIADELYEAERPTIPETSEEKEITAVPENTPEEMPETQSEETIVFAVEKAEESKEPSKLEPKKYVISEDMEFIGTDLKTYSLKRNDIIELPEEIAELLIRKGNAQEALS